MIALLSILFIHFWIVFDRFIVQKVTYAFRWFMNDLLSKKFHTLLDCVRNIYCQKFHTLWDGLWMVYCPNGFIHFWMVYVAPWLPPLCCGLFFATKIPQIFNSITVPHLQACSFKNKSENKMKTITNSKFHQVFNSISVPSHASWFFWRKNQKTKLKFHRVFNRINLPPFFENESIWYSWAANPSSWKVWAGYSSTFRKIHLENSYFIWYIWSLEVKRQDLQLFDGECE